jgi:hypothetical protein
MVSVIDEEYEIYEDCEALPSEILTILLELGLGTGPPDIGYNKIEIIINE